ncbi:2,3-diaminopropionate biosynthesis protein SbnA [Saccharothrix sp. NRRL B-16314]|uniref:2,3-diaminopropionate biosynthesis protein SbnA n=1 Tax=Saccharothrix sp. NRRL B-16314 TaxID=1463825 RepID=UPI000527DB82|nr:2,3-diaminopropionate biosynthesis protein SbnA [Saccharothrix sp. NRRL B-16314]
MIRDRVYDIVTDEIYLRLPGWVDKADIYLKIEGLNPAGSVKLKTAIALIEDAEISGVLSPGGRVVESSSGNLGIALSMVCSVKGYPFVCITDPNASARSVATMRALGARVVVVSERDANGGYLGTRIAHLKRMLAEDPTLTWTNQYANAANPRAHWERTAASILKAVERVDYLFVGAGTTGTLMGCAAYFREFSPRTRIIAVDTLGSVTFGHPAGPRHIPGLGTSRTPELCTPDLVDDVVLVDEADAVRACRGIAARYGLLVGGSTGSVVSAVRSRGAAMSGASVVALSPDLGDRYLDTVYNDDWVTARFGPEALTDRELAGTPLALGG